MRKLVVLSFVTLDGVMQATGNPEEDPRRRLQARGWSAGDWTILWLASWKRKCQLRMTYCLAGKLARFLQRTGHA